VRRFAHLCEGEPRGRTGVHELGVWRPASPTELEDDGALATLAFQDDTLAAERSRIEAILARLAREPDRQATPLPGGQWSDRLPQSRPGATLPGDPRGGWRRMQAISPDREQVASVRARLTFVGLGGVALLGYVMATGSARALIGFALLAGAYSLVLVALERGLAAGRSRSSANELFAGANALGLTGLLVVAGQLQGPLAGLYAVLIFATALGGDARAATVAGVVGATSYAGATLATWLGWIPGLEQGAEGAAASAPSAVLATAVLFGIAAYGAWTYAHAARRRLREAEQRYRTVLESASEPILLLDARTGRYLDANASASALFRGGRERLLGGLTAFDVLDESEHAKLRELLAAAAHRGPRPPGARHRSPVGATCGDVVSATCELGGHPVLVVAARRG
jgi:PAS domain-containing protein